MLVKICGVTTLSDACAAVDLGADLLGFNFYPKSRRYIDPEACAKITAGLMESGRQTIPVGIFVNAPAHEIHAIFERCILGYAQLSGDESPGFCSRLGIPWIKALRPKNSAAAQAGWQEFGNLPNPARPAIPTLLVDAYHPGEYGGTGQTGDWSAAARLAAETPIFLAGGLNPDNVGAAVRQVRPAGVDVASGVENTPGLKDIDKMARFIRGAKGILETDLSSPPSAERRNDKI